MAPWETKRLFFSEYREGVKKAKDLQSYIFRLWVLLMLEGLVLLPLLFMYDLSNLMCVLITLIICFQVSVFVDTLKRWKVTSDWVLKHPFTKRIRGERD